MRATHWFYSTSFNGPRFPAPSYRVQSTAGRHYIKNGDGTVFETDDRKEAECVRQLVSSWHTPCVLVEVRR